MKKLFISLFVLFSLMFSTNVFAATTTSSLNTDGTQSQKGVLLAQVNIRNPKIVSQNNNEFNISFSITNGEGLQTGIKYGIMLIQNTKSGKYVADEKIYDDSLTLNSNSKIEKSISYTAPSYLDGEYEIILSSKNNNNLPFASVNLGKVTLNATSKGIQILPETCSLGVEGEKDSPKYNLYQLVDIKPEENIKLTCTAVNGGSSDISTIPSYETHIISSFGDKVEALGGSTNTVALKSLEKKEFSVLLPKASTPQSYNINFTLDNNDAKSNTINIRYLIRGSSASIKSLSLDKDYYNKGDNALIFFTYFPSVDSYFKGRYDVVPSTHIFSRVQIKNSLGLSCIKPQMKDLVDQVSTKVELSALIKSKCFNPKVTVTLTDENGKVLDQKEFNIKTTSVPESKSTIFYILIIVALLVIAIIYFYMKKKNTPKIPTEGNDNSTNNITMSVLFFLIITLFSILPTNVVKADTVDLTGVLAGLKTSSTYCAVDSMYSDVGTLEDMGILITPPSGCYILTSNIPVVATYDLSGEHSEGSPLQAFSYGGGELQLSGSLVCGDSSYCFGYTLKADATDNYITRKQPGEGSYTYREYDWLNNTNPITFSPNCDYFGSNCGASFFTKVIPYGYGTRDPDFNINFSWYISHLVNNSEVYDVTVSSLYDSTAVGKTLYMVYPQLMVDVTKDSGTNPIIKGNSDALTWNSYPDPAWATIANPKSCDCHIGSKTGTLCPNFPTGLSSRFGRYTVTPNTTTIYHIICHTD